MKPLETIKAALVYEDPMNPGELKCYACGLRADEGFIHHDDCVIGPALAALQDVEEVVRDYAEAQQIITEQHSKLWLVGLETHPGEPPQSRSHSHRQLDSLLDEAGRP